MTQAMASCNSQWFFKLLVQNVDQPNQKYRLNFYPEQVKQLVKKLEMTVDLNTAEEEQIQVGILQKQKILNISFDKVTNRVEDIGDQEQ